MTWLLPIGLCVYAAGAFLQIAEEWRQRGLTDTSFRSLACLTIGPTLLAAWSWQQHSPVLGLVTAGPASLALGLIALKLRDGFRNWRKR